MADSFDLLVQLNEFEEFVTKKSRIQNDSELVEKSKDEFYRDFCVLKIRLSERLIV